MASISRTLSDGGIPVYQGTDVTVIDKPSLNFDGLRPQVNALWYGAMSFDIGEQCYKLEGFLNYGAEGQTYVATQQATGKKFALKFCNDRESMEVKLLKQMPRQLVIHPNFLSYELIVQDVYSHFSPAHHILIMDYVPNGELFELLASAELDVAGKPVSQGTSRRFLHDVISGMAECYRFGVTHRDLKPENLLINAEGRIVIIDLGHAKRGEPLNRGSSLSARTSTTNVYGTVAFNAPEVHSKKSYDCEASDVWSVGVIAFYLHAKLPPFTVAGGVATWDDIKDESNDSFWNKISSCGYYPEFPDGLKGFINTLWRSTPSLRPTFSQLEQTIGGDTDTVANFPGLQWLAEPTNDAQDFIDELRRSCPGKTFTLPKEVEAATTATVGESSTEATVVEGSSAVAHQHEPDERQTSDDRQASEGDRSTVARATRW